MQIIQQVIAIVTGVIKEPIVFKFHLNLNNHIWPGSTILNDVSFENKISNLFNNCMPCDRNLVNLFRKITTSAVVIESHK